MSQSRTTTAPDETLASDILPLLIAASVLIAIGSVNVLFIRQAPSPPEAYLLPLMLLICAIAADSVRRRGAVRTAGAIIAYALALLPMFTISLFGLAGNPVIYLSALGVICAGLFVSARSAFIAAGVSLLAFGVEVAVLRLGLGYVLAELVPLSLLLLSIAALSALAAHSMAGTIAWALDAFAKSERREELLRQTQQRLEQALIERDHLNSELQIANHDLEAARAAAEAAYRTKASFMATMSHELRTPLNLIIGYSGAMLEHPAMYLDVELPEIYRNDIIEINRSGQHLLHLINDILDLAKVEAGRLDLQRASLPIEPLLQEALKTARSLLADRPVLVRESFERPLPSVYADEMRVRQVLLNLVSNACKWTDRGTITIGARVENNTVLAWVRDTGVGIEPADQARIFGEFEQVESLDNKKRGGTGLGLAICRWLIELHGGRIWVESQPNHGSTFYFTLPVVEEVSPEAPQAAAHEEDAEPVAAGGR